MTDFLGSFWVKHRQTLLDYGASHGKYPKGFRLQNYAVVEKGIESQVLAIFMYRMRHVFPSLVHVSSLCQHWLAYILYESRLLDVFRVCTRNTPRNHDFYITYIYIYVYHRHTVQVAICVCSICASVTRKKTTSTSYRRSPPQVQVECLHYIVAGMKNTTSKSCWRSGGPGTSIHWRTLERDAATTQLAHGHNYEACKCPCASWMLLLQPLQRHIGPFDLSGNQCFDWTCNQLCHNEHVTFANEVTFV